MIVVFVYACCTRQWMWTCNGLVYTEDFVHINNPSRFSITPVQLLRQKHNSKYHTTLMVWLQWKLLLILSLVNIPSVSLSLSLSLGGLNRFNHADCHDYGHLPWVYSLALASTGSHTGHWRSVFLFLLFCTHTRLAHSVKGHTSANFLYSHTLHHLTNRMIHESRLRVLKQEATQTCWYSVQLHNFPINRKLISS